MPLVANVSADCEAPNCKALKPRAAPKPPGLAKLGFGHRWVGQTWFWAKVGLAKVGHSLCVCKVCVSCVVCVCKGFVCLLHDHRL